LIWLPRVEPRPGKLLLGRKIRYVPPLRKKRVVIDYARTRSASDAIYQRFVNAGVLTTGSY